MKVAKNMQNIQIFCIDEHFVNLLKSWPVWPVPIRKKVNTSQLLPPQHQSTRGPESASIEIPPFRPKFTW